MELAHAVEQLALWLSRPWERCFLLHFVDNGRILSRFVTLRFFGQIHRQTETLFLLVHGFVCHSSVYVNYSLPLSSCIH